MAWPELIMTALGSGVAVQGMNWLANRGKNKADASATQVDSMLKQLERLQKEHDDLKDELKAFRKALYPHQRWDLLAWKRILEVDPEFPPPPDLYI
jgi:hypothetical protein